MHVLVESMLKEAPRFSAETRGAMVAAIGEIKEDLLSLVADPKMSLGRAPGQGYGPVHAVSVLVEAGVTDAIPVCLQCLATTEPYEELPIAIAKELPLLGGAVVEPCLEALGLSEYTKELCATLNFDDGLVSRVCEVLALCGVRDERIFALLTAEFAFDPVRAWNLATHGDVAAVSVLTETLDRWDARTANFQTMGAPVEIEAAIRELGGTLTPEQQEKVKASKNGQQDLFRR